MRSAGQAATALRDGENAHDDAAGGRQIIQRVGGPFRQGIHHPRGRFVTRPVLCSLPIMAGE